MSNDIQPEEKIFSIHEDHTDILVKGTREAEFGHKVNLTTGKSNIILDVEIVSGNPGDSQLYEGALERVQHIYGVTQRCGYGWGLCVAKEPRDR